MSFGLGILRKGRGSVAPWSPTRDSHCGRSKAFYFVEALETRRLLQATLLAMETFGTNVTSSNPDAFDTATGTIYSDAIGPTTPATAGTIGVSGDPEQDGNTSVADTNSIQDTWLLTGSNQASSAADNGFIGGWFRFTFEDNDTYYNHLSQVMSVGNEQGLFVDANDQLEYGPNLPIANIPLNTWTFIGMAWTYIPGAAKFNYQVYTEPLGGSLMIDHTQTFTNGASPSDAELDDFGADNVSWEGRVGTFFIESISSFSDVAIPSEIGAPVEQKVWFGVDPVNGNDNNDGVVIPIFASNGTTVIGFAPGSEPWQTQTRVNTALAYAGLLTQNVAWVNASDYSPADESLAATTLEADIANGTIIRNPLIDELVIDTTSGPLNISATGGVNATGGIQLNTNINLSGFGSDVGSMTNVGSLSDFITIDKDSWTLVSGTTDVYESSETGTNAVLWQDDEWMNHPLGNTFSEVESSLELTPGSFWTDGTTMYVHSFGNTDPATDSSVYQRSPGGTYSNSIGVLVNVTDAYVHDLAIGGTCGAMPDEDDAIGLYCLGGQVATGLTYFDNLYLYYSDKHAFAWTDDNSNDRLILNNVDAEQGSPYTGFGGQYLFTNYNSNTSATGNQVLYIDCTAVHSWGLIGSTEGTTVLNEGTYYNHNNGPGVQFSIITFIDCNFDGGIFSTSAADDFVVINTSCSFVNCTATELTAQNVTTSYDVIRAAAGTVSNCAMGIQIVYGEGVNGNNYDGDVIYTDCVFNFSNAAFDFAPSLFYAIGPCSLTITDSVFIGEVAPTNGNPQNLPITDSFQSNDTIDFSGNIYNTAASTYVATNFYNGSTEIPSLNLAQWQALGYDAGSTIAAATTASGYTVADIGSPAIAGTSLYDSAAADWANIGGGAGIGGDSDQFNFAYASISGQANLVTDVTMQAGLDSASAGLMYRDSTAADGAFADVVVTQAQNVEFQWRTSDGASAQSASVDGVSGPVTLELIYSGGEFSAYYSQGDGWAQIGTSQSVSMPSSALAGMVVTGGNNVTDGAAVFTNTDLNLPIAAPTLESFQVNDGSVQRAMVDSLTITFNEPVALGSGALTLNQLSNTGGSPTAMSFTQSSVDDGMTWIITFTGPSYVGGSLPDGNYQLNISAGGVTNASGQAIAGGNSTFAFSRLYGDFGGQGLVNAQDFEILAQHFGQILSPSLWYLDYDNQGVDNAADFFELEDRFGTLPPAPPAVSSGATDSTMVDAGSNVATSAPAESTSTGSVPVTTDMLPCASTAPTLTGKAQVASRVFFAQPPPVGAEASDFSDLFKKDTDRTPWILRQDSGEN